MILIFSASLGRCSWPSKGSPRIRQYSANLSRRARRGNNVRKLTSLPRARVVTETVTFGDDYRETGEETTVAGNLVPDAHVATILHEHGVRRIYTADTDFRKFEFLEVINPLLRGNLR
jgi:predicted nucleic acid-binding protein